MDTTASTIPTAETAITVQPCGWSPDELRAMVAQEQELRTIIVEYYRSQMISNKHYYSLQAGQKPALSKEGALNLCSLFKVRVEAETPCDQHHDDGHYSVRYRVRLVSMRTGEGVADGDGFCSTQESKYAYRWLKPNDLPNTVDPATLFKRTTRYGAQVRIPTTDLADHYNTVLKMAYKRAIVAAALCLPLVSELFTQDLEENRSQPQPTQSENRQTRRDRQPAPTQRVTAPQYNAQTSQTITPQQLKQLWAQINRNQVKHDAFAAYLGQIGLQSTKALSPAQLEQCLSEIQTRKAEAFQPQTAPTTETNPTRAQLFDAISMLQVVIAQAEETQPPGEPYAQTLIELAEWIPRVSRACENPETPEDQLQTYLLEVNQSLDQLQELALTAAAA